MQFNEWETLFQHYRKRYSKRLQRLEPAFAHFDTFYDKEIDLKEVHGPFIEISHLILERTWYEGKRPYYNVYPSIIPMLTALKLDVPVTVIEVPMPALLVRLPVQGNPLSFDHEGGTQQVRSILFGAPDETAVKGRRLEMWIDIGERGEEGRPASTLRFFFCTGNQTIEEAIELRYEDSSLQYGIQIPAQVQLEAIKLVCTLCLLANDPELIEPDVLAEDEAKFDETKDQKLVERAHRRNKVGWNVGKHIEKMPHYRRPHLALFWTGKGRTIPKIGPRKGSIVKRTVVGEIPTGYLDEDEKRGSD